MRLITIAAFLVLVWSARPSGAADVILNEYNAVGDSQSLENGESDPFWGSVQGNGGDWFEMVVITDHLDMRNWQLVISDTTGSPQTLFLTNHGIWADLRSGTIITVSEDLENNVVDYNPAIGSWWLNVLAAAGTNGTFITPADFRVNNSNWQLTIRNASGVVMFGPAGEGVAPASGVGNNEVCKLEASPSAAITPLSNYQDGNSSTFAAPNGWNDGASVQDFSALRSVVPYFPLTTVRINEVLSHSDTSPQDWVELYNVTAAPIDIGRWYLSDNTNNLTHFQIPIGTMIGPGGYATFFESQLGFALSASQGDLVLLSEADANGQMTGGRDFVQFGAAPPEATFGRFPNGHGQPYLMTAATLGSTNSFPVVGPVVINEIMYHPADLPGGVDNVDYEFVELHNPSAVPVNLFTFYPQVNQTHPWSLVDGVNFAFATGTTLMPGAYLLVVGFDPAIDVATLDSFRAAYGLDASAPIVGPYSGKLSNSGETVELRRPDTPQTPPSPDAGLVPQILVDDVTYSDHAPWPTTADGAGRSLERIRPTVIANDVANWIASNVSGGSPGAANTADSAASGDADQDLDVDLADFVHYLDCRSAPQQPPAPPPAINVVECLLTFDFDFDSDVDLADFADVQASFSGP